MTRIALVLDRGEADDLAGFDEVFLWPATGLGTFRTKLSPSLNSLGAVTSINADFVRLALAVYAADKSVRRDFHGSNWNRRTLELSVPVSDPAIWTAHRESVTTLLAYLTGDQWSLDFRSGEIPLAADMLIEDSSPRTVLLSGGADSATGALLSAESLRPGETHNLVSHASSGVAKTAQQRVSAALNAQYPGTTATHHRIFLRRSKKRLDGSRFRNERSSRSRSLLFLALGLAVAGQSGGPLLIPENGFASLNPPLGPERVGALSTRTTQPWFLWSVSTLISDLSGHGLIINPYERLTKGEMFGRVKAILGADGASHYLSETNSCSHTDQHYLGVPSGTHCGVCFGCVVRRSSFMAAGIVDQTTYLDNMPTLDAGKYLEGKSVLTAVSDFIDSGIEEATIMSMPLPPNYSARSALELARRGMRELADFVG
ncbi:hypothetical protein QFZ60_001727 [Arthrobacter sp. B2I5]|uniref:hypothetical protein n=1 Tax=Arthrobacter sp. B2I5 TaxID=3042266 RepID=UPI00277EC619|nr:hypothetical protein [Arthrobacter sp. B2I5]MDQ0825554.1 hypothetical protein [Arthrobacter sp. B2I5]